MDAASVLDRLRAQVEAAGSARAFALRAGVSAAFVLDCLHERRRPGPRLLKALGIQKQVTVAYVDAPQG